MRAEEAASQTESHISMLQLMRSSDYRMPLTIGVVMQLSQQLSGINAVSTTGHDAMSLVLFIYRILTFFVVDR